MSQRGDAGGAKHDIAGAIVLSIPFHVKIQFIWRLERLADSFVAIVDYRLRNTPCTQIVVEERRVYSTSG